MIDNITQKEVNMLCKIYNKIEKETNWSFEWIRKVILLCLEYMMCDDPVEAMRMDEIRDEIQSIVGKTLTHDDLDFILNEED